MKISGNDELNKFINETTLGQSKEISSKTPTREEATSSPKEDTIVHLSPRVKEIQAAREAMESQPDIRQEKLQEIKDRISNGTYEIDHEKTAEKMVATFFEKII